MPVFDIQAGDNVSTKQKESERWITNTVVSFNENERIIELTLKPELLESLKEKDDAVEVKIVKEDFVYSISGTVEEIIIDLLDRMKVKIESLDKAKNNRTELRYDVWLSSEIRNQDVDDRESRYNVRLSSVIIGEDIDISASSLVTNISRSGMAVLTNQNLAIDSEIFIDVQLGYNQIVRFKGRPLRKRANGYRIEYGISSEPIDELNLKLLNDYLEELEERNNNGMSIIKKIREKS